MENGNVIYNNIDLLSDLEKEALGIYENGTKKELKNFFEKHFEEQFDYSFTNFKKDLFQKAKGYTKIENKVFTDALDEAFKQSSLYDVETYRKSKEIADKYFNNLGRTKEAQDMILDYIANDIDIDSDALIKANAKYFETQNVNHGLYAFPDDIYTVKGPTNNPLKRIDDNIRDIINDKQMEMSLSSNEYMIGPIGVTGKTSPIAYHVNDMRSHLEFSFDGGKRVYQQNNTRGTGTVKDIIESLERESKTDLFARHDELIGKGLDIESLWVKEDFYSENQDYVHSLMQKYKINNLDIIHASENTEKISSSQIEKTSIDDINKKKKLTPQEAFDKYGPNDDRFYTSQGLDPKEQKEKINKFNSKVFNFTEEQINKYNDNFINQDNILKKAEKEVLESIRDEYNEIFEENNVIQITKPKPKLHIESEPDISNKRIKEINKDKNSFVNKHFTSPTLKKLKRESKDSIFFKLDKSVILPLELDFNKNGISVFGNDTTAFILAHGADDGKISLRRNGERLLVSSKELTGSLEDMLPDTIKDIYTINCYGGKQKEYYTNRGIHVQSIHQDKIPIESLQDVNSKNKVFGILTTQKKLSKEITDNIYKNVYKNKLLSETPNLKNILLPERLEEVINGLYLKQWQNIKNKKPKTKKSNKKPKSKKQNKKSKPKKQINKNVDNIELPKQNQRKPKVLGERLKQQQIQKDVLSKKSIQEQQTLLDLKKSIDKPVNQNTERKLQKKELSHQELYDLNKNNNQGIKQKINNVNTTSKNTNTPKVKGEKLDIIGNRKDMAMMVDILKNNGQKTADETAAQIAKNICSSGNRYGKGAISILSKIV